jgi:hypothetical protein
MYSQNSCTAFANSITFYITNRLLKITSMDEVPICILCCDNFHNFLHTEANPIAGGEIIVVIVVVQKMLP